MAIEVKYQPTAEEPVVRSFISWTPPRIESAKRLASGGNLEWAADLAAIIFGDDRAIGPLQAIAGIGSLPVTFETDFVKDAKEVDPKVEALERDWWRMLPEETQGEILRWGSILGSCWAQILDWVEDEATGRVLPVLSVWHQRNFSYDGNEKTWKVKTVANPAGVPIKSGDGEWMHFTPYGVNRPWEKAPWFALAMLWLGTQYAKYDLFDFNDSNGQPIKAAYQTSTGSGGGSGTTGPAYARSIATQKECDELSAKLKSLVRGGAIALPAGFKLELLSATGNGESFFRLIDDVWPKAVSIALTGNNLSTQIDGGSYAASQTAEGVSIDRKRTFARCLETTSHRDLLPWWGEYNWGDRNVPWPKYGVEPPKDRKAIADTLLTGAKAIQTLRDAGFELTEEEVEEVLGRKVRRVGTTGETDPTGIAARLGRGGRITNLARASALTRIRDEGSRIRAAKADDDAIAYNDAIVEAAVQASREILSVDVGELIGLIDQVPDDADDPAETLASLRRMVLHHYSMRMSPIALMELVERAEVLMSLNGRHSILQGL